MTPKGESTVSNMTSLTKTMSGLKISEDVNVEIIQEGSGPESQSECKDALLLALEQQGSR